MNQADIPSPAPQPSKTKPVLFSLLILASGVIIGAGATLIITNHKPQNMPPAPEYMSRRMLENLTRELHLTPEQQKQIHPIIEKHMTVMDEIRNEARPKIRQELEAMNAELMALLDNTQKQIWKERIQRMQQRFPGKRPHRGPGDRRPDESRPGPKSPEQLRFRERIPGPMPPPPPQRQPLPDSPPPPQEPVLPPAQDGI